MCIYMRERSSGVSVCKCNSSKIMAFLDIKEYVKAMKTVRRRNMVNHEMELAIGEELQTFSIQLSVRLSKLLRRQQKSWCL